MKVKILKEAGFEEALYGLGLSYGLTSDTEEMEYDIDRLYNVSMKLYNKEDGHNKFLESIQVWLLITAPRFLHSEIDTYRVGCSKQSESTMHTLLKKSFNQEMFEYPISETYLKELEGTRLTKNKVKLKNDLPEGFLQKREWNLNYKVLRNICVQRKNHELPQWKYFCDYIYHNLEHAEYFDDIFRLTK
jgi:hypothetical protein